MALPLAVEADQYDYAIVKTNSVDGSDAVLQVLNAHGQQGFHVVATLAGGLLLMERQAA